MNYADTDFAGLLPTGDPKPPPASTFRIFDLEYGMRPDLWEQFFRARYRAFGGYEGTSAAIAQESDKYDEYSTAIVAVRRGEFLGGCRLIDGNRTIVPFLDMESARLPFDIGLVETAQHFEISRMVLSSALHDHIERDIILYRICDTIAVYAFEKRGYSVVYSDMIYDFYRRIKYL